MPRKSTKKTPKPVRPQLGDGVEILNAGSVLEDPITRTLETNYMPYAMSVIVSRALPEIDGFKPAHRKLLYTMYEMGLLKGARTKSANIVGSTMHLNPHGDAAIYDTMVRMGRGNESLLVPYVDSKGKLNLQQMGLLAYAHGEYFSLGRKLGDFGYSVRKKKKTPKKPPQNKKQLPSQKA